MKIYKRKRNYTHRYVLEDAKIVGYFCEISDIIAYMTGNVDSLSMIKPNSLKPLNKCEFDLECEFLNIEELQQLFPDEFI